MKQPYKCSESTPFYTSAINILDCGWLSGKIELFWKCQVIEGSIEGRVEHGTGIEHCSFTSLPSDTGVTEVTVGGDGSVMTKTCTELMVRQ